MITLLQKENNNLEVLNVSVNKKRIISKDKNLKKDDEISPSKAKSLTNYKDNDSLLKKPVKPVIKSLQKSEIFEERKKQFKKKLVDGIERENMTMFDLIYFKPTKNPMPGRAESQPKRARLNSKSDTGSVCSMNLAEEQKVDDIGLDRSENTQPEAPFSPTPSVLSSDQQSIENDEEEEEETSVLAPQLKIGPDGSIMVDEKSLMIKTTAAKNKEVLHKTDIIDESTHSTNRTWSKKRVKAMEWTEKETARFYRALATVGTDFSIMAAKCFIGRSREELKKKFKKEERLNRKLVDLALADCRMYDLSLFEEESGMFS